jgi:lipopolysaccharide/colanic/teichoic acid biosynthesis glycosyltransferase
MVKRLFDICFSGLALLILSPVFVFAAVAIKISSPGTVFYLASRAGLSGKPFKLIKFRTMRMGADKGAKITAFSDDRVFWFGKFLRKTKLDELPQFFNVLVGDMSVVGPRPEDIHIVERYYKKQDMETLSIRPGMVSPGSLYNYTHGCEFLDEEKPVDSYSQNLLPIKLALEKVYINRMSLFYDIRIIVRTAIVILKIVFGQQNFSEPQEFLIAKRNKMFQNIND